MDFKSIETVSEDVKQQIASVTKVWRELLGADLIGVYIHGSLCLNCFLEGTSDIDMLIISARRIPAAQRIETARRIIELDCKPSPLEMSAIFIGDLTPWQHPTRCQFHYSDYWTERYQKLINGEETECYIVDNDFEDADIACHCKLMRQSGICVCGKSISEVFPEVPEEDFWQSISCDIDDYDFNAYNERYYSSNILILGRILSYKVEKRILSKYDGGIWTRNFVPERFRPIVDNALSVWYEGAELQKFDPVLLNEMREFLINEIKR